MDNSDTYILMCEKAEEIQNWDCLQDGDYYWYEPNGKTVCIYSYHMSRALREHLADKSFPLGKIVRLPRQDQLQEMIQGYIHPHSKIRALSDLIINQYSRMLEPYWEGFTSMEQLWLAFVMRRLYNKTWTGSEWKLEVTA